MTATQQFIEDAIKGGWKYPLDAPAYRLPNNRIVDLQGVFLDPLAWQAVGKTRGWNNIETNPTNVSWLEQQHNFIDYLANGKTIEEALSLIA